MRSLICAGDAWSRRDPCRPQQRSGAPVASGTRPVAAAIRAPLRFRVRLPPLSRPLGRRR